jgi:hypothetical protein
LSFPGAQCKTVRLEKVCKNDEGCIILVQMVLNF